MEGEGMEGEGSRGRGCHKDFLKVEGKLMAVRRVTTPSPPPYIFFVLFGKSLLAKLGK